MPSAPSARTPSGTARSVTASPSSTSTLPSAASTAPSPSAKRYDDSWRQSHLGRLLGESLRRFDARVLTLMAHNINVPLALSNLAARGQVSAAHIHITRHVALEGSRLTDLAQAAGMSKQAMGDLVQQCEAWGIVARAPDHRDARARLVCFTPDGLQWLKAFEDAVVQASDEFSQEVGKEVAQVVGLGLEAYSRAYSDMR